MAPNINRLRGASDQMAVPFDTCNGFPDSPFIAVAGVGQAAAALTTGHGHDPPSYNIKL